LADAVQDVQNSAFVDLWDQLKNETPPVPTGDAAGAGAGTDNDTPLDLLSQIDTQVRALAAGRLARAKLLPKYTSRMRTAMTEQMNLVSWTTCDICFSAGLNEKLQNQAAPSTEVSSLISTPHASIVESVSVLSHLCPSADLYRQVRLLCYCL
jgi:hypothetical protein